MLSQPLFAPIQELRIKYISRKDIKDFMFAQHAYENIIDAQPSLTAVSYRYLFDAEDLESYVCAEVFGEGITTPLHLLMQ